MKEDQYNKLRKTLNIDSLDEKTKRKLTEDFKKAGGKIDYNIFDKRSAYLEFLKQTTQKASGGPGKNKEQLVGGKSTSASKKGAQKKDSKKGGKSSKNIKKKSYAPVKSGRSNSSTQISSQKKKQAVIEKKINYINQKTAKNPILEKYKKPDDLNFAEKQLETNLNVSEMPQKFNPSLIDKILFSVNGFLLNVSLINPVNVNPKFIIYFFNYYSGIISNLGYFVKTCVQSTQIKKILLQEGSDPLILDALFHFNQLLNENFLSEFQTYLVSSQMLVMHSSLAAKFFAYFRKLFFIKQNTAFIMNSLLQALNLYKNSFSSTLSDHDIADGIRFISTIAVKKFQIIYCININKYFSLNSIDFAHIVKLTEQEKIGYYLSKIREEEKKLRESVKEFNQNKKEIVENDIAKKEELKIPDDVKKGFLIMDEAVENTKDKWDSIIESDKNIPYLDREDKILPTYIFLKEFIDQYSVFLLSKNIQYKLDFIEHKKIDIKFMINDAIDKLLVLVKEFETYSSLIKRLKEFSGAQTAYVKRLESQKNMLNRTIRENMVSSIRVLLRPVAKVILDYKEKNLRFVDNYEENLYIDEKLMGAKKNNGKKIIALFVQSYYFLKALEFRLDKTDLSGNDPKLDHPFI